jgi:hypothetical protein
VDHNAGRVGGDHRVGVALGALVVDVGDRDVQVGGGRRHRAEQLAPVDPPSRLGAGRQRGRPCEVLAAFADGGGEHHAVAGDLLQGGGEAAGPALLSGRDSHAAAALHVEHRHQVHVHPDRHGGVAARQAARRHDQVVRRRNAPPTEFHGHGRREVPRRPERVDRLERVGAVAVVLGRAGGEVVRELLGDRHEAGAGLGARCQFDRHGGQSVLTSTATGTPLVTMS